MMPTQKPGVFYFANGNEQNGPFQVSDIPSMLSRGEIQLDSLVWAEGMKEWSPLKETFKEVLPSPPPLSASKTNSSPSRKEASQETKSSDTCKACGALVEKGAKECACCGVQQNVNAAASGKCPDCTEPIYPEQWFCTSCFCPVSNDKKFLKAIERHAHNLRNAFAGMPAPIRQIVEAGDETLEYVSGAYLLTNKRIIKYGDPQSVGRWLLGIVVIIAVAVVGVFIGEAGGLFIGAFIGLVAALVINQMVFGSLKSEVLLSINVEDITSLPDAKSHHGYVGNTAVDSYWVEFDSLSGPTKISTGDFDGALTLAHRIRDVMEVNSAGRSTVFHTLGMVLRRMKAKGVEFKQAA